MKNLTLLFSLLMLSSYCYADVGCNIETLEVRSSSCQDSEEGPYLTYFVEDDAGAGSLQVTDQNGSMIYTSVVAFGGGTTAYYYVDLPSGLDGQRVTVTYVSIDNCERSTIIHVNEKPKYTTNVRQPSCAGASDGEISLLGMAPSTVPTWADGSTATVRTDLSQGDYTVTLTAPSGCTSTVSISLVNPEPLSAIHKVSLVECNGVVDRMYKVYTDGGTGPYTYAWRVDGRDAGIDEASIHFVDTDNVSVMITDANGCQVVSTYINSNISFNGISSTDVTIPAMQVTGTGTDMYDLSMALDIQYGDADNDQADGSIYKVSYHESMNDAMNANNAMSSYIVASQERTYYLRAEGASNCFDVAAVALQNSSFCLEISEACDNADPVELIPVECSNTFTPLPSDGVYEIYRVDNNGNRTLAPNALVMINGVAHLDPTDREGNYDVEYTYVDNGVEVMSTAFFDIQALNPRIDVDSDTICGNLPTFEIRTNPRGGELIGVDIINEFVRGSNQFFVIQPSSLAVDESHSFTYTYSQTNDSGLECEKIVTQSIFVETFPIINIENEVETQCEGSRVSQVATIDNPTPTTTYAWRDGDGNIVGTTLNLDLPSISESTTFSLTATRANSCIASDTVEIDINPLPRLQCEAEAVVTCPSGSDGVATVDIVGVSDYDTYSFEWSTGSQERMVTNLGAGTYTVSVTTVDNCVDSCDVFVREPNSFDIECSIGIVAPLCEGTATGSTVVNVAGGGTRPYMYSRDNINFSTDNSVSGFATGTQKIYVRDAEGCIDSCFFEMPSTPPLSCEILTSSVRPVSCNGLIDGTATVSAAGGTGSYSYLWDNGEVSATATRLAPGDRSVTVSDSNGCTTICSVVITEPTIVACSIADINDAICNGTATGSATVQALGGVPGYTIRWSDGQTTPTATGLFAGSYQVTVSDANGCSTTCDVSIDEPTALTANPMADLVCEGDMVFVDANPDSRIVSHSWAITGGTSTGAVLENADEPIVKVNAMQATPGSIILTYVGRDIENCPVTAMVEITVEAAPNAGEDVSITICNTDISEYIVDLTDLLGNQVTTGGLWRYSGALPEPDFTDPTSVSFECYPEGPYTFTYFISPQGSCSSRSALVTINVEDCFDLAIMKTVDNRVLTDINDPVTFNIEVINQGDVTAFNVEITDYIEPEFIYDFAKNTAANTGNANSWQMAGNDATLMIGDLLPNTSRVVTIILDVNPSLTADEMYNSVEITSYAHRTPSGAFKLLPPDEDDMETPPTNRDNERDDDIEDDSNGGDDNPSDDDQFDFAVVTLCGSTIPQITCNDLVNISLDGNCEGLVTPDMILEGNHPSRYIVILNDTLGNPLPNPLTADHIGMDIVATVMDDCSPNSCWSRLTVEDKFAPEITCVDDVTISCLLPDTPLDIPLAVDACEGPLEVVIASDDFNDTVCESGLRGIRTISYYAEDSRGNRSETCTFTVSYDSIAMDDIFIEESIVLECDDQDKWDGNGNYYPEPWEVQVPSVNGIDLATYVDIGEIEYENYCKVNITYDDVTNDICENSYNLVRKWSILNWCSGELLEQTQVILVTDTKGPIAVGPANNFMIVADQYECTGDYLVQDPTIISECGTTSYTVGYLLADETGQAPVNGLYIDDNVITLPDGRYVIRDLPVGQTWIRYTIHDGCGNRTFAFTEVVVVDEIPPIAVCDEFTSVTLTSSGIAQVNAFTFDDGSHDNCSEDLRFEARRMQAGCGTSTQFDDHVTFCCADVAAEEIMVEFRVWDDANGNGIYGDEITVIFDSNGSGTLGDVVNGDPDFSFRYADNSSTCMVSVKVDDKTQPLIVCPDDITLDCGDDYTDLSLTGDASGSDNCGVASLTHKDAVLIDQCGAGTVVRTFTVEDLGGRSASCSQTITIIDTDPFDFKDPNDLTYPRDVRMEGCEAQGTDVSQTGEPTINGDACNLVAYTYSDRFFALADSACYKIYRTFTVIDWCQFDQSNPDVGVDRRVQTIYIDNTVAPTIANCDDTTVCIFGDNCNGEVTVSADASDDCTPANLLQYILTIDYDNNGTVDRTSFDSEVTYTMDPGVHRVRWIVADRCGNTTECNYLLTVEDCKKPTPYCLSEVTTVIMPTSGMISITASDFDLGSTDNCDGPLTFSFDESGLETTTTFECSDLGLNEVDIWVTDAAGNSDFCTTWVHIQSNGSCDGSTPSRISGSIASEINAELNDVAVTLKHEAGEIKIEMTENGSFAFEDIIAGQYELTARNNSNHDQGVTTLDLVMIQRHILGLSALDSPYKILAADVNNTESVSGADVVELRKLILGINSEFESSESWMFLDAVQTMDSIAPWSARQNIDITLTSDSAEVRDFVGIKKGDVNNTAVNGLDDDPLDSRSADHVQWYQAQPQLLPNGTFSIVISAQKEMTLAGYQFTLEYDADIASLVTINGLNHPIGSQHYREVTPGVIAVSLDMPHTVYTDGHEALFEVIMEGQSDMQLAVTNNVLRAEAYDIDLLPRAIEIGQSTAEGTLTLLQNTPNPFKGRTQVQFELTESANATLSLYDMTGRMLKSYSSYYIAGQHTIDVEAQDLGNPSGIVYYQLTSNGQSITKKMMVLR